MKISPTTPPKPLPPPGQAIPVTSWKLTSNPQPRTVSSHSPDHISHQISSWRQPVLYSDITLQRHRYLPSSLDLAAKLEERDRQEWGEHFQKLQLSLPPEG